MQLHRLAKYSRTSTGVPVATGKDQSIGGLSDGDHRSLAKIAFGVDAGTLAVTGTVPPQFGGVAAAVAVRARVGAVVGPVGPPSVDWMAAPPASTR